MGEEDSNWGPSKGHKLVTITGGASAVSKEAKERFS
jgi:hypothetical protein